MHRGGPLSCATGANRSSMIPKSGNRFSDKIMLKGDDDPEKWEPVFDKVMLRG